MNKERMCFITDCLLQYCKAIAAEAPDLPFYFYHIPSATSVEGMYFTKHEPVP